MDIQWQAGHATAVRSDQEGDGRSRRQMLQAKQQTVVQHNYVEGPTSRLFVATSCVMLELGKLTQPGQLMLSIMAACRSHRARTWPAGVFIHDCV